MNDFQTQIDELKRQVAELIAWKEQRMKQQITFPLDEASRKIISENLVVFNGQYVEVEPNPLAGIFTVNGKAWGINLNNPSIYE